jgi:2-keto-myo-inositol isomerase
MNPSRRELLSSTVALAGATIATSLGVQASAATLQTPKPAKAPAKRPADEPFGYCLNTSTIRGNNLDIVEQVGVAAKAGYNAIEPWVRDVDAYKTKG